MDKFTFPRGGFTESISAVTIDWNGPEEEPERERRREELEKRLRLYIYTDGRSEHNRRQMFILVWAKKKRKRPYSAAVPYREPNGKRETKTLAATTVASAVRVC